MTSEFKPKKFALLTYNKMVSDFYEDTPQGRLRRTINETKIVPLRTTIIDNEGKNIVYRLLADCDSIIQSEQVKLGFPANMEFTQADRDLVRFKEGILEVKQQNAFEYLTSVGHYLKLKEGFKRPNDVIAMYDDFEPTAETKKNNSLAFDMAKALNKVASLNSDDKKSILIKVYGSHYQLPVELEDLDAEIIHVINVSTDEERSNLDLIISFVSENSKAVSDIETFEDIENILGKAIDAKLIDFNTNPSKVLSYCGKGTQSKPIEVFDVDANQEYKTRVNLFANYLFSKEGEATLSVIKSSLKKR